MTSAVVVVLAAIAALAAGLLYLAWYVRWEARNTTGLAYYGRTLAGRRDLKRRIRLYSAPVMPLVRLLGRAAQRQATMPTFDYEGVAGPPKVSSPEVFARAKHYRPVPEDVFVVTQMRCGTTWMQQIVYEVVSHGQGDLGDAGHGHLYRVCPWIEAINSVSMEAAPIVGRRPSRIIKSHLSAALCPYSEDARYIYVTRHPVACFASIVDFNRSMQGPFALPIDVQARWFCSDRMYWQPWPVHVSGWWDWAETRPNVLFLHFEDMKRDLPAACERVARFLGCPLTPDELARVAERSSFGYMKKHEDLFEMAPPTMFSVAGGKFLASGAASRGDDVPASIQEAITSYCRDALRGTRYAQHTIYADLADTSTESANPRPVHA